MKENKKKHSVESPELFDKDKFFTLTEDLFLVLDSDGNVKWSNPTVDDLFNDDNTDRNIFTIIHPTEIEKLKKKLHQLASGITPSSFEMKIDDKQSGHRWFLWNSVPYNENDLYYFAGTDITNQKVNEEEIKLIYYTSRAFNESDNLQDSLKIAISEICRITNWPYGEAFIKDSFTGKLTRIASWHEWTSSIIEFDEMYQYFNFDVGQGLIGKAWNEQQPRWMENIYDDDAFLRREAALKAHLNSMFIVPVITGSETIAVIAFFMFERNPENERLVNLISAIVSQLSNLIERKQIEEKLRRSERVLKNAEKIAHMGSWEWDFNNKRMFWSDELYSIFGIPKDRMLDYQTFLNMLSTEGSRKFHQSIEQICDDHQPFEIIEKYVPGDGRERFLNIKGEVVFDKKQNVVKITGTVQDITVEKEINDRVMRSELYYRSLIENSLDMKSIIDLEGRIKFISPSVQRILGYSTTDLINKNLVDFIHPDDHSILTQILYNIKGQTSLISTELRFRGSEGNYCFFESIMKNLSHIPYVEGIVINSRDITAKKIAENAIKTLMEISWKLNSTMDADELMDILVLEAMKLVDAEMGTAGLRTAEGLTSKKLFKGEESEDIEYSWSAGQGIPGKVLMEKEVFIGNELSQELDFEFIQKYSVRNLLCVPILDPHNKVIGFFQLMNRKNEKEFSGDDLEKSLSLSQTASAVIQNAIAYQKILMTEAQLKNSREQLRRLSAHLQSAREEERTRISREIHDELGQALTGLKMDLSWLDKKVKSTSADNTELLKKLDTMGNLVDGTIKTVRKISSELRPGVLDYLGLGAAIEWQAQDFQNRTGIICTLDAGGDYELNQNSSTAVFRIFQETLTNVARHSRATEVKIRMAIDGEDFILEIEDNGKGITETEIYNNKSLGLLGMRERANLIGGDFHIKGTSTGTVVSVIIPYNQNESGEGL